MSVDEAATSSLASVVRRWVENLKLDPTVLPRLSHLETIFQKEAVAEPTRPPAHPQSIVAWEGRHGHQLPRGLRAWLALSDGLYRAGPLIHPLTAIGPMIPFATMNGLIIQPESWFELGNPSVETVCIDLAYQWPNGDCPIFTSGDDETGSPPRIIASSFESWLLRLLQEGGREYWFDPDFTSLGDPWVEHRRRVPPPPLPARLKVFSERLSPHLSRDADERAIASAFGITRGDVEAIFRHIQHAL